MRAFIAFEIDDTLRRECEYLLLKGKKLFPREIKWVDSTQLHITFLFLGDVLDSDLPVIKSSLQVLSEKLSTISLSDGVLRWNNPFKPSIIWIEYAFDNREFDDIRKEYISYIKSELPYLQIDKKDFKWHVTLGRVKNKINIDKWQLHNELFKSEVCIKDISLYQSILQPQGPVYRCLGMYNLVGQAYMLDKKSGVTPPSPLINKGG